MKELQQVRAALELSAKTFREYEKLHHIKKTEDGYLKATANAEKASRIEVALTTLDSYIARLESEKLVMDIAKEIYTKRNGQWDYHLFRTQQEPYIKDAQAATNIIRGE